MTQPLTDVPCAAGSGTPGDRRLPLAGSSSPGPRRRRHVVAAVLVAGYLVAAVVVIAAQHALPVPQWLALHLLVLGAATNAVFVWSRHFAQALLHARLGSQTPAHVRLAVLNAGVVCVLSGVALPLTPLAIAGAVLVAGAVVAHTAGLLVMARGATLPGRLRVTVRFYIAGGLALSVGAALGAVLAAHAARSDPWQRAVVLMHAHLNLLGWLGLSVIGTQFMLWPAVLRTRMADHAPAVARRVLTGASAGLAAAVTGLLLSPALGPMHWLAAAGMALYTAAAAYALTPAARQLRAKRPRTACAWALLLGNAWLIAALALDVAGLARGLAAADRLLDRVLLPLLGLGVLAQILTGALGFLLPVTVGGGPSGNRRMTAVLDYGWPARAALGNTGVLILAATGDPVWRAAGWTGVLAGFGTFPPAHTHRAHPSTQTATRHEEDRRPGPDGRPHVGRTRGHRSRFDRGGSGRPRTGRQRHLAVPGRGERVSLRSHRPVRDRGAGSVGRVLHQPADNHGRAGDRPRTERAQQRPDDTRSAVGRHTGHAHAGPRPAAACGLRPDRPRHPSLVHRRRSPRGGNDASDPRRFTRRGRDDDADTGHAIGWRHFRGAASDLARLRSDTQTRRRRHGP